MVDSITSPANSTLTKWKRNGSMTGGSCVAYFGVLHFFWESCEGEWVIKISSDEEHGIKITLY